jgi:hypothetical protein
MAAASLAAHPVDHVRDVDTGGVFHHLGRELRDTALSIGRIVELARPGFSQRDQFLSEVTGSAG